MSNLQRDNNLSNMLIVTSLQHNVVASIQLIRLLDATINLCKNIKQVITRVQLYKASSA